MDLREEAKRLFLEERLSPSEIGERLGVKYETVKKWKQRDKWTGTKGTRTPNDTAKSRATSTNRQIVKEVGLAESLTDLERDFCMHYIGSYNATQAAYKAGYSGTYGTIRNHAWTLLRKPQIVNLIKSLKEMKRLSIMADIDDLIELQMRIAFSDIGQFVEFGQREVPVMGPFGPIVVKDAGGNNCSVMRTINFVDFRAGADLDTQLIAEISQGKDGAKLKLASRDHALDFLERFFVANPMDRHKMDYDNKKLALEERKIEVDAPGCDAEPIIYDVEDQIIPKLLPVLQDKQHAHIIITSGRAATKSSYAGIQEVDTVVSSANGSVVVLRKFHNKIRKTVYRETLRAINRLSIPKAKFKITVSPFEIRFNQTGNTIYFTGNDSIDDTKGMIDETRPIKLVVLDEVTEFFDSGDGEDELLNIEATFARGNDDMFQMLYLFNPPKNPNAPIMGWLEKMKQRPDVLHVHIDYQDVPESWLGAKLIEAAEQLRQSDIKMYNWIWRGQCIGIDELIYYMFSDRHVQAPPVDKENRPVVPDIVGIGVDYGQQNATTFQAFGVYQNLKRCAGLGEYYHSGRDSGHQRSPSEYAQDFVKFALQIEKEHGCIVQYAFIDPSAQGLAEEIKRAIPRIIIRDAQNSVALGISRVQKALTFNVMTINPSQKHLKKEFGLYSYDRKSIERGKEEPIKENDHCQDATRYCLMGLWKQIRHFLPYDDKEE